MQRELRDYYNKNSEPVGKTYYKGDPFPDGLYPMVVMVCIQNSKGELLMQKRVPSKGGDWGVTGGHPKAGETPIEGMLTEIKEEIGLTVSADDLILFSEGFDGRHCYKQYYLKIDIDPSELTIQEEELSEVKWFSISELDKMAETGELNPNQIACFVKCKQYLNQKR